MSASVFVSHASSDNDFCAQLAQDLKELDFEVWYDEWEIKVGDSLRTKIAEGIEGHDFLAVVLSEASVASSWVKNELNAALDRELKEQHVVVLPLLIQDCEIPTFLRDKKWADFRSSYDQGLRDLVDAVEAHELARFPSWPPRRDPSTFLARSERSLLGRLPQRFLGFILAALVAIAAATIAYLLIVSLRSDSGPPETTIPSPIPQATISVSQDLCGPRVVTGAEVDLGRALTPGRDYWGAWMLDVGFYPLGPASLQESSFAFSVPQPTCGFTYDIVALECTTAASDELIRLADNRDYFEVAPFGCSILATTAVRFGEP